MSLLSRLFGKNKAEPLREAADISVLHTDIHSHLIPGIDDGAQAMEDTLEMLERFAALGYRKIITTPHVMSDFYKNTPEIILSGLDKVRAAAKGRGLTLEIEAAAEYYLDDALEQLIEDDQVLTFGKANYLLFELPFVSEPVNTSRAIFNMQLKKLRPVLAHPERYGFWHHDMQKYHDLYDKGVLLQVNMNSISGYYGPDVAKVARYLIDQGMVRMLGTDCHRLEHLDVMEELTLKVPALHRLLESGTLLNHSL